jgi:hypothetical protein
MITRDHHSGLKANDHQRTHRLKSRTAFRSGLTAREDQDSCCERRCCQGNGTADRDGCTSERTIGPLDCLRQRANGDDRDGHE